MINELLMASQSVQALGSLLKSANGLANYSDIVEKMADVHAKLLQANAVALSAQEKQASSAAELERLRTEVTRLNDWSGEASNYEVREIAQGIFVMLPVAQVGKYQSVQKLCVNCFNQGNKSLLQQQHIERGRKLSLVCHRCKADVIFNHYSEQA
jgi:hypothetical protein